MLGCALGKRYTMSSDLAYGKAPRYKRHSLVDGGLSFTVGP